MSPTNSDQPILCMDTRMLGEGGTGVATYARNLLNAMPLAWPRTALLVDDADPLDRAGRLMAALSGGPRRLELETSAADTREILRGWHIYKAAQARFTLRRRLLALEAGAPNGIMHWTYPVPIYIRGWRNIYTVHDVIPLEQPSLSPVSRHRLRAMLRRIALVADRIVTVSEASRRSIIAETGFPAEQVVNCYQAVERGSAPACNLPAELMPGRYLLFYGTLERRKNVARVIRAYGAAQLDMPLVIAGPDPDEGLESEIASLLASPGVVRLPYLPAEVLAGLIAGALTIVFPSLAEGFGLPVAEGIVGGIPVITSRGGALEEVAGGAALLVDPRSEEEIARAMRQIVTDGCLRGALVERAGRRASTFSTEAFADRLRRVYSGVAAEPRFIQEGG